MKTKVIGLTGGIGSGKSTVARMFETLGVPVYYADDEAKKILYTTKVADELHKVFGEAAFTANTPDRAKIAALVFSDKEKLRQLNAIIHPRVALHFNDWVFNHQNLPFVIKEAAILFESGAYKQCDAVITVTAPQEVRIDRVMARDGALRGDVEKRMANQWAEEKKIALSDYVIENISLDKVQKEVVKIFNFLNNPKK
ncbi:dephospho-CoA kinase [Flavobacterium sp. RHBU_24]|uniref:dephospho-CoA kinase n=1 Tax=Flavobacterium sp. RHBU_24 TaxID=3391185 RepID=UPI003985645F